MNKGMKRKVTLFLYILLPKDCMKITANKLLNEKIIIKTMADFSQYKLISSKLKKRFLSRKPNLSEASDQFSCLARDLKDFKAYAGFCSLAVARCEHNQGNISSELQALLDSARSFRDALHVNAAISAYRHALKLCDESLAAPINAELAQMYKSHNRFVEAAQTFADADFNKEAAECFLRAAQYEQALDRLLNVPKEQLDHNDCVTIFLLKLYLNDAVKYDFQLPIIECNPENDKLMDLNILLESLLISMRSKDDDENDIRNSIASNLFPKLNGLQNDLLYIILTEKSF